MWLYIMKIWNDEIIEEICMNDLWKGVLIPCMWSSIERHVNYLSEATKENCTFGLKHLVWMTCSKGVQSDVWMSQSSAFDKAESGIMRRLIENSRVEIPISLPWIFWQRSKFQTTRFQPWSICFTSKVFLISRLIFGTKKECILSAQLYPV